MEIPVVTGEQVLIALRDAFYQVVPVEFQTYCALTARISCRVLRHFGISSQLEPCQLWWVSPERNFIVGYYQKAHESQWEGHVVCRGDDFLIDAALYHVTRGLGVQVPKIVIGQVFGFRSNVLGRHDLSQDTRLWWHRPPADVDTAIPDEPEELVARYSEELIGRIERSLGFDVPRTAQLVPAEWQSIPSYP